MSITSRQIEIIKSTIPVLRESGVALTVHFYKRMFAHNPELKHVFNKGNQSNTKQQTALAMAILAYAENIENPQVLMPVVDGIGHKHTSLNIRPEHYAIVGKHLIASIHEVLGVAATPELLEAWTVAYNQLANIMMQHEQKMYNDKVAVEGGWSGWRPFVVKNKVEESSEITSFYLYPVDEGNIAHYLPGQYISLKLFIKSLNLFQARQYSLSTASNGKYYRISVKKAANGAHPDGIISNSLHVDVQVGDRVELSAPAGNFYLKNNDEHQRYVLISGGVGQTPLMAMLESLTQTEDRKEITWIHGARNPLVHAFKEDIAKIKSDFPNVREILFYEQSSTNSAEKINEGMVDLSRLDSSVIHPESQYYICGPAPFIEQHYAFLCSAGIEKNRIFYEEFSPQSISLN